jgi:pseudouridylate synthase I
MSKANFLGESMRNIKLTIEYDGTNYHGWQSQKNADTVQDFINLAVSRLTGEEINITGSSRTDTGVHAYGQVANFFTESTIPADKFTYALNSLLPEDIVITKSEEVDSNFHARFSTKGKKYRYLIYNSSFRSAILRHRAYHVYYPLDLDAIKLATHYFLGTHDFSAFMATGSCVKSTVRTIKDISVDNGEKEGNSSGRLIRLDIAGDGFLYNMVRIIAGTLVQVGYGRIKPEEIPGIIADCDRKKAGKTAPAHGLYLIEIYY